MENRHIKSDRGERNQQSDSFKKILQNARPSLKEKEKVAGQRTMRKYKSKKRSFITELRGQTDKETARFQLEKSSVGYFLKKNKYHEIKKYCCAVEVVDICTMRNSGVQEFII